MTLAKLEERDEVIAAELLRQRDLIAAVEGQLGAPRADELALARADRRGALAQVRDEPQRARGRPCAPGGEQATACRRR